MAKWIKSVSAQGKPRSMERINLFAVNNAFAEQLPFTCLNCIGVAGKHITYNHKGN